MNNNKNNQKDDLSNKKQNFKIDIHSIKSRKKGFFGAFESLLRKFKNIAFFAVLGMTILVCLCLIGISLSPSIGLFDFIYNKIAGSHFIFKYLALGFTLGLGFFIYGLVLIIVVPIANYPILKFVRPWRGNWFSIESIPWFYHNALTYLVRFTFLDFITPSPLNILFFRLMGMKVGKGVMINTTFISDPCLITLEDFVTIGGSATIFAHYGQKGILIISPVIIKRASTVGLKASIMGDVVVGEKVVVPPHKVLLPKTRISDGQKIEL